MQIEKRAFGRSGLRLSILGFGCGAVGGLMVRGDPADQERAVARALEAGVNYFDTAVAYGDGESEKNLGRILKKLKPTDAIVGTKVRLRPSDFARISDAVSASLDGSLQRLGLERVDIFHFHNPITVNGGGDSLSVRQMLDELVPAFESQRQRGKTRFLGITAVGDTAALHEVIGARVFDSAQVSYNMAQSLCRCCAAGELSGARLRAVVRPPSYDADLARARRLRPLVEEGFAGSLSEAAIRFAMSHPAMGTILVGMASPQQFEHALAAVLQGPLSTSFTKRPARHNQL